VVLENNVIEMGPTINGSGWGPPTGIWFYNHFAGGNPPPYLYDQVVIRRNVIRSLDGVTDPYGYSNGMRLDMCAQGIVEESVVDLNSLYFAPIWQVRCNPIKYLNNETSAGVLIQGQIYETGQFAEELSTLIELACVQCF
jgi:hypothetical protein